MSMPPPPPPTSAGYQGDPTNVMGRRIGAYVIDAVIGFLVFGIAFFALADSVDTRVDLCGIDGSPPLCLFVDNTTYFAEGGKAATIWAIGLGYWVLIAGTLLQGLTGGTPGKLMVGLRVVNKDTGALGGVGRCALRSVMWIVDAAPFIFPLVGLITGVATKGHRRVGDMLAGTLVVRAADVGRPPQVAGLTTSAPIPFAGAHQAPSAPPSGGWAAPAPAAAPFPSARCWRRRPPRPRRRGPARPMPRRPNPLHRSRCGTPSARPTCSGTRRRNAGCSTTTTRVRGGPSEAEGDAGHSLG